jgi:3-oxoacyl-[acyl-carrier protein] reductase
MLLRNNAKVVVLDINQEALDSLKKNDNILKIFCDLTDEIQVSNAINETIKKFLKIDILVNNAGILYSEPLIKLIAKEKRHSLMSWRKVIDINLTAPFVLASYVVEQMVLARTKGVIVNISSISATGNAGQSAYSAAKAGIEAMSKVWAKELGVFGIRSVAIAPGFMNTESTLHAVSESVLDHVRNETPIKRLGNAQEISHSVKFAIENDYLNGKVLQIDGGLTI